MTEQTGTGRGPTATADMKRRLTALRDQRVDVIDVLWERHRRALLGEGYRYEFAEGQRSDAV